MKSTLGPSIQAPNRPGGRFIGTIWIRRPRQSETHRVNSSSRNFEKSYPHFLQPENRQRFIDNLNRLELLQTSFGQALNETDFGYFNKIHLSNLGDWSDETDFNRILDQLKAKCQPGSLICNRYLQKNHFASGPKPGWGIDENLSALAQRKDRFPFYGVVALRLV